MTHENAIGFTASYPGTTATLNQARVELVEWLEVTGGLVLVDAARLVLSELASNAVEASPDMAYRVHATCGKASLRISVTNKSAAPVPAPADWQIDDVLADRGRGLGIVRALADEVYITAAEGEITISVILRQTQPA